MTTQFARRTMLPPHLTRHLYETRRLIAEGEGRQLPPWYRLTAQEQAAVEMDMEVFRRAVLRAEEEQDLVAAYNAATTEPQPPQPAAEPAAAQKCTCPGCTAVAAVFELMMQQAERLETTLGWDVDSSGQGTTVFAFPAAPLTGEERARLEETVRESLKEWEAAGKPLKTIEPTPEGTYTWTLDITAPRLTPEDLEQLVKEQVQVRLQRDDLRALPEHA